MVSKYDMKKHIEENPDTFPFIYKEEDDSIYSKEDGEYVCSLEAFVDEYRKLSGESFECIYDEHVSLYRVLRCTECGTVIFTYDDFRYDPNLKCPTCTNYETDFKFWTQEDIDSDEGKQEVLNTYKEIIEFEKQRNERIKRRKGKQDWQIAIKKIMTKKWILELILECDNITDSYFKGLRLKVNFWSYENPDDILMHLKKFFTIPLSWSAFYYQFIYKIEDPVGK